MNVYEIKFMCYVGDHEYSQIEYFYGTAEDATRVAFEKAASYWGTYEEDDPTEWDESEQAWVAHNPYRGVRIDTIAPLKGILCETVNGFRMMNIVKTDG